MEYVGTRWHKTDLHLHTGSSACYAGEYSPKAFVDRALEQGLQCIAVTDHNTGAGIDAVKEAADSTDLVVFPGVEVTCSDAKVHLLLLFDIDRTGQQVDDFLLALGLQREKFGMPDAHVHLEVHEVATRAHEKGALIIPAHVDDYSGLSSIAMQPKKQFFDLPFIHAAQVVHQELLNKNAPIDERLLATVLERYGQAVPKDVLKTWKSCAEFIERRAVLTFSDNPQGEGSTKHGLWGVGNRYTWIKMGPAPRLESLRQALLMPELRVRNFFQSPGGPTRLPKTWLRKLSVANAMITEPNATFTVEFSPQMTTIIGGRGSGKSAILKFVRGALDRTSDLVELAPLKKEFEEFFRLEDKAGLGVLTPESSVELELEHNEQLYRVRRTQPTGPGGSIEVSRYDDASGAFVVVPESDYVQLFPTDIYSQKQIYEVAQSPNALRERIDAQIPACRALIATLDEKRAEYLSTCGRIRECEAKLSEGRRLRAESAELEARVGSFRKSGMEELISEAQAFDREAQVLSNVRSSLESKLGKFDVLISDLADILIRDVSAPGCAEYEKLVDSVKGRLEEIRRDVESAKGKLSDLSNSIAADLRDSAWQQRRAATTGEVEAKRNELGERGVADIAALQHVLGELNKKQRALGAFDEISREASQLDVYRAGVLRKIIDLRGELTKARGEFLKSILGGTNVNIEVRAFKNREQYESAFRGILDRATGFEVAMDFLLDKVFKAKVLKGLEEVWADLDAMRRKENVDGYDGHFRNLIAKLSDEQLDKLRVLLPEDEIVAQYRPNVGAGFRNISNGSAGQKTASILSFVLSHGTSPLILDQPEDDLDNHLVYGLIVDRLRAAKEGRQIIVVTHNANVPVNGDAEYTIAMRSDSNKMSVLQAGTIEEERIQREICEVMEGGEEAFGLRSARYSFRRAR